MANYKSTSPWYTTSQNSLYLDILNIRPVPADPGDRDYIIENKYRHRPDLLAYDLYGSSKLWWVFSQRNISLIKDPIYDFEPGTQIKIPQKNLLMEYLGI
jgi:hypothetical protein